jgi:hypothetical protein
MECGKAPTNSSAPVVSNQMEPTIRNMLNDLQITKLKMYTIKKLQTFLLLSSKRLAEMENVAKFYQVKMAVIFL